MPSGTIRNDSPTLTIRTEVPTASLRYTGETVGDQIVYAGTPIGLLLALTYSADRVIIEGSGEAPYAHLRTTD